jgi:hypothetical protein
MTVTIGRHKSYFHTHGHDCMMVRFTSTNVSCHGHDCMIVGFMSTYGSCHGHAMTATIGRHKSYYHTIMTMTATIGIEVNHTIMTMTAIIDRSKSSYHTS